jgi:ABC-type tungstate transport system substrate-binding protein
MTRSARPGVTPWLLAVAGYTSLTLLCTWPLACRLATVVPHDVGDPLLTTWILWWNAHTAPLTARWWDAPMFWPMAGALALSEHMLGLSLIASPLQWLGADPITAYNVLFLLSFPLCAVSAHALAYTLTGRHDAAALGGVVFAFNPYRTSQIAHLHILWVFWMPLALMALHRYARDGRRRWLLLFAAMWVGQALSNGYFLLFFPVLIALWAAWFLAARRDLQRLGAIAAAWCLGSMVLLPLVIPYQRFHERLAVDRNFGEIVSFSADVGALVAVPPLALASRLLPTTGNTEQQLFPGFTVVALIVTAMMASLLWGRNEPSSRRRLKLVFGAAACGCVGVALFAQLGWPWQLRVGGTTLVSVSTPFKPLTAAIWCLVFAVAIEGRLARAWNARSALPFYVCAAAVMYVLSFGPQASFLGTPFWYRPPYAWLMELPGFSSVRAPARFAMLAELCLSAAAPLAFVRIRDSLPRRFAAAAAIAALCGAVADGWIRALPLPDLPPRFASLESLQEGVVVELPVGDVLGDIAALYRSMYHRRPIVNGYSGFMPTHYRVLRIAIDADGTDAFDAMTSSGPLTVVEGSGGRVTTIPAAGHADPFPTGRSLAIHAVFEGGTGVDRSPLTDGNGWTRWDSASPQDGSETMTIDLGSIQRVDGLTLAIGPYLGDFPRVLAIDLSDDLQSWTMRWSGRGGAKAVVGGVHDPRMVPLSFGFPATSARWVRLRQLGKDPVDHWSIAELTVFGR